MEIKSCGGEISQLASDSWLLGYHSGDAKGRYFAQADALCGGALGRLAALGVMSGKACETLPLFELPGLPARQVVAVGLGGAGELHPGRVFQAASAGIRAMLARPQEEIAILFDVPAVLLPSGVAGAIMATQGQDLWRKERKVHAVDRIGWHGADAGAIAHGKVLGDSINLTRKLVDSPPEAIYPETFAAHAEEVAAQTELECEIWDEHRLAKERCGALLAVAKGSSRPPRAVILRYPGRDRSHCDLALVGKGVTFDSGGLSLKTSDSMLTMKCDMAGAATVLGAMRAIALLRPAAQVMGLMGLVENMPGPMAMKLGDVVTARNGTTIEIHNTDAEGRLVLADMLSVAVERGARSIVDVATLTGSCVVALGRDVAGMMSNNPPWCDQVAAAAAACGEHLWQLPMFEEYDELIESPVADIKNVGDGRWGGAITAAKFLERFVADVPWAHLDIAGPAFAEKPKPWLDGGATGAFVRTLVELARRLP